MECLGILGGFRVQDLGFRNWLQKAYGCAALIVADMKTRGLEERGGGGGGGDGLFQQRKRGRIYEVCSFY